ncbi:hypothetical protein HDE_00325 [Halotydeus destructor]|nr:hypothetical protein HDE_00325 [Halotydeus destructor]
MEFRLIVLLIELYLINYTSCVADDAEKEEGSYETIYFLLMMLIAILIAVIVVLAICFVMQMYKKNENSPKPKAMQQTNGQGVQSSAKGSEGDLLKARYKMAGAPMMSLSATIATTSDSTNEGPSVAKTLPY